jgi:hypothetical protein
MAGHKETAAQMNDLARIAIFFLPLLVFIGGGAAMRRLTERREVARQLKANLSSRWDILAPNQRLFGYTVDGLKRYWGALNPHALALEHKALRLDLLFPLLYGSALAVSLLLAWNHRSASFFPGWLLPLLVTVCLFSDWTENLIQLRELRLYKQTDRKTLEAGWVRIASAGTSLKLLCFLGCYVSIGLLLWRD